MTVRPAVGAPSGPSPARMPTTRYVAPGRRHRSTVSAEPTVEPVLAAPSRSVTRASGASRLESAARPGDEVPVVEPRLGGRVDPEDRDRAGGSGPVGWSDAASRRGRSAARARARRPRRPGVPAMAATRLRAEPGLAERRDAQVGPARSGRARSGPRRPRCRRSWPARRTGRRRRGRPRRSSGRSGTGGRAGVRQARPVRPRIGRAARLQAELGEPRDERRGVVRRRRPRSIVSRIRPSPMTRTRSA